MKKLLILLILFFPTIAFNQVIDSILPPPQIEIIELISEDNIQKIDLKWADTIINKIQKISFVQLRPLCDDGKKRKTQKPHPSKRIKGCYEETVITSKNIFRIDDDPRSIETIVTGFDLNRIYKWKEIDTIDYNLTIVSTLGKRKSEVYNMCYNPRHAILFLDSNDTILGLYEICFECGNGKIAFNNVESINIYGEDYRALKKMFLKYGYIEQKKTNKGKKH